MPDTHAQDEAHPASTTETLISVENAALSKGGRRILENVSITVGRGEIVTLIGPNGAGKSMLIRVALGLEPLNSGHVRRTPGLKVGYQPQKVTLDETLPLSVQRFLTLTQPQPVEELKKGLADVQMPHLLDASIHTLSGGEFQRVMLARAMLRRPDLLVLDEPEQNVDTAGAVEIYQLIARLREETGCGILLVSHDLNVVMAATDRVYCLHGHICCSGTPDEISGHAEFLRLFGPSAAKTLAVYPHHHDHDHAPDGSVTHTHAH
jgi:zinc transport system ATP-binding protein